MDHTQDQEPGQHPDRGQGTPRPRGEGVRIIGAEEAAAAVEAGQVAGRRPEHEPRFGDVPVPPPGPRAPHRFPLPDSVDPAAVPRPPLAGQPSPERGRRVHGDTRVDASDLPGPLGDAPQRPAPAGAGQDPRALDQELADWTALAGPDPGPEEDPGPPARPGDMAGWAAGRPLGGEPPPEMLHWADPPTGEVPRILAGEPSAEEDDLRAWSRLIGRGPSWRDRHSGWEDGGYEPAMLADDHQAGLGAHGQPTDDPTDLFSADPGPGTPAEPARRGGPPGEPAAQEYGPPPSRRIRIGRQPPTSSPRPPGGRRPDMGLRLATGLGIFVLTLVLLKVGPLPSFVLALAVVVLAAAEGFAVLHQAGYRPATLLGLTATASLMIASYLKGETAVPLILALMVAFSLLWYLAGVVRGRPTVNVAVTWLGFMWAGFLGSFAALLLNPRIFPDRHGVAFLLGALLASVGHDVGGWLIGGQFGRHPMAPRISPNKTWEGLVGGMAGAILVSAIVTSQVHPWNLARAVALGVVVAVVAPLGDLCESMIKRDIGVKDMGSLLPGHGGMLDRIDALLFVLPATYYLVRVLKIG